MGQTQTQSVVIDWRIKNIEDIIRKNISEISDKWTYKDWSNICRYQKLSSKFIEDF